MKQIIKTDQAPGGHLPFSQVIRAGDYVFTCGMAPLDPATLEVIGDTVEEQTRVVLRYLSTVLSAAGASLEDVVKVTAHLGDHADFPGFNQAYQEYFREPFPVRTTVGSQLGRIKVEIDVIAYVGGE